MIYVLYARPRWLCFLFSWDFIAMSESLQDVRAKTLELKRCGLQVVVYGKKAGEAFTPSYYNDKPEGELVEEHL